MATFSTANRSAATVSADVDAVWDVLTDPDQLARLTPFLHSVTEEGEHWVWQLSKVPVLGASFSFTFRERMDFDEPHRIDFTHDPAPGVDEKAGVVGWYKLAPRPSGTHLETSMQITVDLPFPGRGAAGGDGRDEGRHRADGPAVRAQPARPPRRQRPPEGSTAANSCAISGMSAAPHIVVCRKQLL